MRVANIYIIEYYLSILIAGGENTIKKLRLALPYRKKGEIKLHLKRLINRGFILKKSKSYKMTTIGMNAVLFVKDRNEALHNFIREKHGGEKFIEKGKSILRLKEDIIREDIAQFLSTARAIQQDQQSEGGFIERILLGLWVSLHDPKAEKEAKKMSLFMENYYKKNGQSKSK